MIEQVVENKIVRHPSSLGQVRTETATWVSAERVMLLVLLCVFWGLIVLAALSAMQ